MNEPTIIVDVRRVGPFRWEAWGRWARRGQTSGHLWMVRPCRRWAIHAARRGAARRLRRHMVNVAEPPHEWGPVR